MSLGLSRFLAIGGHVSRSTTVEAEILLHMALAFLGGEFPVAAQLVAEVRRSGLIAGLTIVIVVIVRAR